jgi:cobalt-precorrin 5A hydrolase/precorrin-3B C17-methyltransferase
MIALIVFFAGQGETVAERIALSLKGELVRCGPGFADAATLLPAAFSAGRTIIGVAASGILIRLLAPVLSNKALEPAVLAVSIDGASIVPLLGGHRGANHLARTIAALTGGHAAITTASDIRFGGALDEPPAGYALSNREAARAAMAAALQGEALKLTGDAPFLAAWGYPIDPEGTIAVRVTDQAVAGLAYHEKRLVAGLGCERGASADEVIGLVTATLAEAGLAPQGLAALASIDIKADEPALLAAARHFKVPLRLFSAADLAGETVPTPSHYVADTVGTPSVAEAAALKAGPLLVEKRKSARATCAISRGSWPFDAETFGHAPGLVHLVGLGPGAPAERTGSAIAALQTSSDWVGYGLYLDLAADLQQGQTEHRFALGEEEVRVRHALELAATGKTVALLCSGDSQIYAMAALAYELLSADGARALSHRAQRVSIATHPGISAFQAASAAAGALIGHDFCCISLSDLLTPREDIEQRLTAAATGDFVTAFYNPRSGRRLDLLDRATAIFRAHRPATCPVIVAKSLGRKEQQVRVLPLSAFDPAEVDMLTIVLIGSSTSKSFDKAGQTVAFTPRGYAKKASL